MLGEVDSIAAGDLDGDGLDELVLIAWGEVFVARGLLGGEVVVADGE